MMNEPPPSQLPNPDKPWPTGQDRPSPHKTAPQQQEGSGRLKIYLGYAAGVGKTCAMLEAAARRQSDGLNVLAACVETHYLPETEARLRGLELVPYQLVEYRGEFLPELDVDTVMKRKPALVLVDDLSHTNAPGLRHPKRYQDVEELLAGGIDVYTTLDIQHLESLNDIVWQIAGIRVDETLPDQVFDLASDLELVDLPPLELQARLREGRVYVSEDSQETIRQLFRTGNLTALRQLALRRMAEWVDEQMRLYMLERLIPGPWPAGDHVLVCVSPSPQSERLIRSGRRLAGELNAHWTALHVITPERLSLSEAEQDRISSTMHLAEEMDSHALTLAGPSVAETVIEYAREHNVTKIVVGQSQEPRWRRLLRASVVEQIMQAAGAIDVYVIGSDPASGRRVIPARTYPQHTWKQYGLAILLVIMGSLLSSLMHRFLAPANLVMIYLLAVVLAALYLGRGPAVLAAVLSVLVFDFFFVPPYLTLAVSQVEYLFTFLALLIVGLLISDLAARVQEQLEATRRREREKTALYSLSRDLAVAVDLESVAQAVLSNASQTLGRKVAVLLPKADGRSGLKLNTIDPLVSLDEQEIEVANWAFKHDQAAGRGTGTLPEAGLRCLPLNSSREKVGVLAVWPTEEGSGRLARTSRYLTPDQRRLLEAFASLTAVAIERVHLSEAVSQLQLLETAEKLQSALLNSISHDLRTPLVSITGALTTLQEKDFGLNDEARAILIDTAAEEAGRLNRLVGNLLEMTRLEAGAVRVRREQRDLQDVIGAALQQVGERLGRRQVEIEIAPNLPLVPLDFALIVQVLVNLIDNALKFSPADSPIRICTRVANHEVRIEVTDHGSGIPEQDLERVFEKFYRVQHRDSVTGTGLGLSISKGLVEAHGGWISAANRTGGGTTITVCLPLPEASDPKRELVDE